MIVDGKIRCYLCGVNKDTSEFTPSRVKRGSGGCRRCLYKEKREYERRNKDLVNSKCREKRKRLGERHRQRARDYYSRNKDLFKNQFLKSRYGIGLKEYNDILKKQNSSCAICGRENASEKGYKLFVDHCHKTGRVRGLLCYHCNTGIGCFGDSVELIRRAVEYLI